MKLEGLKHFQNRWDQLACTFNFIVNIKSTFSQSIPTSVSILKKIKKIIPRSSNTRHIGNIAPLKTLPQILVVSNSFF